jgi:hypothetical protein
VSNGDVSTGTISGQVKKKGTVDKVEEVGALLQSFGKTVETLFGPASGSPGSVGARVGGAPPQLAMPSFSTAGAGAGSAPQAAVAPSPGVPVPGAMRTGVEFNTKAGRTGAVVAGSIQNIAEAVHGFAEKKNQDNISKAQNWLNMYQTALGEGDQYTADLLKNDPKVVKAWEKYLKLEFPKVEKVDIPGGTGSHNPFGASFETPIPMGGQATHGGTSEIVSPKPGVDQQLAAASKNALMEGIKSGDPRAIAKVMGPEYNITQDEFKQHTRAAFGLELTPVQVAAMDEKAKLMLAKMKEDIIKEAMKEQAQLERELAVAGVRGGATVEAARVRASASLKATQMRVNAMKDIQKAKGEDINSKIFTTAMNNYKDMLDNVNNNLAKKDLDPTYKKQLEADKVRLTKSYEDAKDEYEGFKMFKDLMKPDEDDNQ